MAKPSHPNFKISSDHRLNRIPISNSYLDSNS